MDDMDDWEALAEDDVDVQLPDAKDDWEIESDDERASKDRAVAQGNSKAPVLSEKKLAEQEAKKKAEEAERKQQVKKDAIRKIYAQAEEGDRAAAGHVSAPDASQKAQERRAVEQSDLENAADLFGGISVVDQLAKGKEDSDQGISLESLQPKKKDDFVLYGKLLAEKADAFEKSRHFFDLLEEFCKRAGRSLEPEDLKRLGSIFTAAGNDKLRREKEAAKKNKKKKDKVQLSGLSLKGQVDTTDYDDFQPSYMNDYDDFM